MPAGLQFAFAIVIVLLLVGIYGALDGIHRILRKWEKAQTPPPTDSTNPDEPDHEHTFNWPKVP